MDVSREPKLQGKFQKSIIVRKGSQSVGLIGYLVEETNHLSNPGNGRQFQIT